MVTENTELRQRIDAYAQTIYRLNAELQQLRLAEPLPHNVHVLRQRPR